MISEVYGFAVGTTTIEELVHYGIDTIIGVGYVGAFTEAATGDKFIADSVMSDLPLATHYGVGAFEPVMPSNRLDAFLSERLSSLAHSLRRLKVWNSNSLYREYGDTVARMKSRGCQVVNMDTLSVFAAARLCREETGRPIEYAYAGTVTDAEGTDDEWESDLMDAIGGEKASSHDELIRILVTRAMPDWLEASGDD